MGSCLEHNSRLICNLVVTNQNVLITMFTKNITRYKTDHRNKLYTKKKKYLRS